MLDRYKTGLLILVALQCHVVIDLRARSKEAS